MLMPVNCKIFVGGGFDDNITHIVESYKERYAAANPGDDCHYFSWKRSGAIGDIINALTPKDRVTLVGHSYGGDTAFSVVEDTRRTVDCLISIDPVGRFKTAWTSVRAGARQWLNVRAEPVGDRRAFDDTIAWIGGKYPRPPERGQPGAPDFSVIANINHGSFTYMMNASVSGRSGRSLLGGNGVN